MLIMPRPFYACSIISLYMYATFLFVFYSDRPDGDASGPVDP